MSDPKLHCIFKNNCNLKITLNENEAIYVSRLTMIKNT